MSLTSITKLKHMKIRIPLRVFVTSYTSTTDKKQQIVATDYTTQEIYERKSTQELTRALVVLKASSINVFVTYSDKLFLLGRRLAWEPMFNWLMKSTFYGQFAAGINIHDAKVEVDKLKEAGVRTMLCVPIESTKYDNEEAAQNHHQRNKDAILSSIYGEALVENNGFAQMKLTALCDKELLIKMNKYLTVHECNHQEKQEWNVKRVADLLDQKTYEELYFSDLSAEANRKLRLLLKDCDELAMECMKNDVRMMIDAEQTYIQASLGWLVLVLQAKYNKEKHIVYNTYQCYRTDSLLRVKADHELGKKYCFNIAAKLVRGAYLVEERSLAQLNGHIDPINETYEETNLMYHSVFDYLLPYVIKGEAGVMVASHNEDTVDYVKSRMKELDILKNNPLLCFAQIYGMCDHVSFLLGNKGYQTFKSLPYGGIDDTMLYLSRRAHENKSIMKRNGFERFLIKKELKKRLLGQVPLQKN